MYLLNIKVFFLFEYVPREWYEKLWRDFKILDRNYDNLNIRFKIGLGLWRSMLIFILIYCSVKLINLFLNFICDL